MAVPIVPAEPAVPLRLGIPAPPPVVPEPPLVLGVATGVPPLPADTPDAPVPIAGS
jgi:hypothetical protein